MDAKTLVAKPVAAHHCLFCLRLIIETKTACPCQLSKAEREAYEACVRCVCLIPFGLAINEAEIGKALERSADFTAIEVSVRANNAPTQK